MADRIIIVCTIVLAFLYLFGTWEIPVLDTVDPLGPRAYPYLIAVGFLVSAGWLWLEARQKRAVAAAAPDPDSKESKRHYYVLAGVSGWIAAYFAALEPVGFLITTPIFLFGLMAYLNRGKWIANGASSVLFTLGAYFLFTKVLGVSLAAGVLGH